MMGVDQERGWGGGSGGGAGAGRAAGTGPGGGQVTAIRGVSHQQEKTQVRLELVGGANSGGRELTAARLPACLPCKSRGAPRMPLLAGWLPVCRAAQPLHASQPLLPECEHLRSCGGGSCPAFPLSISASISATIGPQPQQLTICPTPCLPPTPTVQLRQHTKAVQEGGVGGTGAAGGVGAGTGGSQLAGEGADTGPEVMMGIDQESPRGRGAGAGAGAGRAAPRWGEGAEGGRSPCVMVGVDQQQEGGVQQPGQASETVHGVTATSMETGCSPGSAEPTSEPETGGLLLLLLECCMGMLWAGAAAAAARGVLWGLTPL